MSRNNRYLTNNELTTLSSTKHYSRINETSRYPVHLLCIDQEFTIKFARVWLSFRDKYDVPNDVLGVIFMFVYRGELLTEFACVNYIQKQNINITPHIDFVLENIDGVFYGEEIEEEIEEGKLIDDKEMLFEDLSEGYMMVKKNNTNDNAKVDGLFRAIIRPQPKTNNNISDACNYCKTVKGSLYCSIHMNCDVCGFNRRFKNCSAHDRYKTDGKYKLLNNCYDLCVFNEDEETGGCYTTKGSKYMNLENVTPKSFILEKSVNTWNASDTVYAHETLGIIAEKDTVTELNKIVISNEIIMRRKYLAILEIAKTQQKIIESLNYDFNKLQNEFDNLKLKLTHALTIQKQINEIAYN